MCMCACACVRAYEYTYQTRSYAEYLIDVTAFVRARTRVFAKTR